MALSQHVAMIVRSVSNATQQITLSPPQILEYYGVPDGVGFGSRELLQFCTSKSIATLHGEECFPVGGTKNVQ